MKKNIKLIILILGIILILIGTCFLLKGKQKQDAKEEKYVCSMGTKLSNGTVSIEYSFKVDDEKITKAVKTTTYAYNTLEDYTTVKANYQDEEKQAGETIKQDCKYDDDNKVIACSYKTVVNETSLDYEKENWLDTYLNSLEKTYKCDKQK